MMIDSRPLPLTQQLRTAVAADDAGCVVVAAAVFLFND